MDSATVIDFKTYWHKKETVVRKWHLIDAKDQVLGRVASRIAKLLVGKTKPIFTPSVDCGDFVIVTNVDNIRLTGNKLDQKLSFHHSGYPGGAKIVPYKKLFAEKPERVLYLAVKRMLPKNRLASRQILRLKMYRGANHPHIAQAPNKIGMENLYKN